MFQGGVTHLSDLTGASRPLLSVRLLQVAAAGGREHACPLPLAFSQSVIGFSHFDVLLPRHKTPSCLSDVGSIA